MSNITLEPVAATAITEAVAAVEGAARKMESSVDVLHAQGVLSTDFISPNSKKYESTASPEQFAAINEAIVAGFTKANQKLLATPTKALSDVDKATKRYWQQQIGARRNDFQTGLEKRENVNADDTREARPPKAAITKLTEALENVEKILQANEWDFDAVDFMDCIINAKVQAGIPHKAAK
jgi:hypothetical protein